MYAVYERVAILIRKALSTHVYTRRNMKINLALECAFRNLGRGMTYKFHLKTSLERTR
jgi:hypothetical protein